MTSADAIAVTCPACKAPAGEPCLARGELDWRPGAVHQLRIDAAERLVRPSSFPPGYERVASLSDAEYADLIRSHDRRRY